MDSLEISFINPRENYINAVMRLNFNASRSLPCHSPHCHPMFAHCSSLMSMDLLGIEHHTTGRMDVVILFRGNTPQSSWSCALNILKLQSGVVREEITLSWNYSLESIFISFGAKKSLQVYFQEHPLSHLRRSCASLSPNPILPPSPLFISQPLFLKELTKVFEKFPSYNYSNTVLLENHLEKFEVPLLPPSLTHSLTHSLTCSLEKYFRQWNHLS